VQGKFEDNPLLTSNCDRGSEMLIFWVLQYGPQMSTEKNINRSGILAKRVMGEPSIGLVHLKISEVIESRTRWRLLYSARWGEPIIGTCRSYSNVGITTVYHEP